MTKIGNYLPASLLRVLAFSCLGFAGLGSAPSLATTFNFSFSASGLVTAVASGLATDQTLTYNGSGTFTATGSSGAYTVTALTGTMNGLTMVMLPTNTNLGGLIVDEKLTYPNHPYTDLNGIGFTTQGSTTDYSLWSNTTSSGPDSLYIVQAANATNFGQSGSLALTTFNITPGAPAPIPGAGTLSWLVLGLGIVIVRRRAISATLLSACSKIAGRAST